MSDNERLAEGYRQRAEKHQQLVDNLEGVSAEATEFLGSVPEYDSE
ncbi:hypothetical protein [Halovenus sp. HT40]